MTAPPGAPPERMSERALMVVAMQEVGVAAAALGNAIGAVAEILKRTGGPPVPTPEPEGDDPSRYVMGGRTKAKG